MKRVWVYEYLSGGGAVGDDASGEAELLAAGTSMRDALLADLLQVESCSVAAASSEQAGALPAGVAHTQSSAGESPLDFVARESALHDAVWLVAPETGGLLAQFQRVVAAERWLGCSAEAIVIAGSKCDTALRLAAQGVLTPLAFADDPATRRWVTKPDDGAGAVATRVHADRSAARDELAARTRAGEPAVLEAWVEGAALSLSLLCRAGGVELLSVNRQHLAIDARGRLSFEGVSFEASATSDPRRAVFEQLAAQVARAIPGLRGYVGIDLVWHDSRGPVVIEVNPRLTCAYVGLSKALGRNLAGEWLAAHEAEFADAR
jgi:tyramine---L-glutamate ligase